MPVHPEFKSRPIEPHPLFRLSSKRLYGKNGLYSRLLKQICRREAGLTNEVIIGNTVLGGGSPFTLIAGPCVIENEDITFYAAQRLQEICAELQISLIFKSSMTRRTGHR